MMAMTTLTAFAHHTPGAHVLELNRGGCQVFKTLDEAMVDVPAGKEAVEVTIATYGWCRFSVQGLECDPFLTIFEAVDAAADAGLPLDAVQIFTAVNTEAGTRYGTSPLSSFITSYSPVVAPTFDDAILQSAIRELLGHQKALGGVEPREVTCRLLDLWVSADPDTEARLAVGFPEMAWAIEKLQNNGLLELHKTIGYGE